MMNAIRYFLFWYFILFFTFAFGLVSYRVAKKIKKNPLVLPKEDTAYGIVGRYFKLTMVALFVYVLVLMFTERPFDYLLNIDILIQPWIQYSGLGLMILSFIWVLIAQYQMKDSWRIGIDTATKTKLITTGLFRISRNPVFAGMLGSLAGLFLATPNAVTLFFYIIGYMLIQIQIRLEEAFLNQEHGILYQQYTLKTRRLL